MQMSAYVARRLAAAFAVASVFVRVGPSFGQTVVSSGDSVAPVFEGWEQNADGTYSLFFGYMNRNWDESVDVPLGPANRIEPGGPDQGQPTHFLPRRNRVVFSVTVPADFGNKEVVWTLTSRGRTERAYGTLLPVEIINDQVISMNSSGSGYIPANKPPEVRLNVPDSLSVTVGHPLNLSATVTDDGLPRIRAAPGASPNGQNRPPGRMSSLGLRVAWLQYRGPGSVTFTPAQFKVYQDPRSGSPWSEGWTPPRVPPDGIFDVAATFSAPGSYVVRVLAHDGYLANTRDVTVNVMPSVSDGK
jgi:hypothetical protein